MRKSNLQLSLDIDDEGRNMSKNSEFVSAWKDYRSRRRWFFGIWVVGLPITILIARAFTEVFDSELPFYFVGVAWLLCFAVVGIRLTLFRCPRCRRHFFCNWYSSNHFAQRCFHCAFPKWAELEIDAQPPPPTP